ncbi:MAG TPA: histidine kinase [Chitinophagaceae bacterium]
MRKYNRIYWFCQLAGWLGMVAVETINNTFIVAGVFRNSVFIIMLSYGVLGIVSTHIFRWILCKLHFFQKQISQIWLWALFSTILISAILSGINLLPWMTYDNRYFFQHIPFIDLLGPFFTWARYVAAWIIIYFMYKILQQNNAIKEEKLALANLAKTTELELLKMQLNPHFLFNALNSIKALVSIDNRKSKDAIVKLSELLRFTLQYGKEQLVPLEQEMLAVTKYFELEQLRFGERLKVGFDMAESSLSRLIPPAVILTLAENAVKHGASQTMGECKICVNIYEEINFLVISVTNCFIPDIVNSGKGIGLKHIVNRLDEIYQNRASFKLSNDGILVTATIQIPN